MARPSKTLSRTTLEDILKSARKHFLAHGYAGASISEIAKEAKVAKSMVYHHFTSKESLWKAVKEEIITSSLGEEWLSYDFKTTSLEDFLDEFVTFRFNLYDKNPDLVVLMKWQRLEPLSANISGVTRETLEPLKGKVRTLQSEGKMRSDIDYHIAIYLIISTAVNPFLDNVSFLDNQTDKELYLKTIIDGLIRFLSPI